MMQGLSCRRRKSADEVGPGAGFGQSGVRRAGGHALHHPCHILPQVAQGLGAFGIFMHLSGAHAVYHVPVEGADEGLIVVGDVFVEAVERGAGTTTARHGYGGSGFVGQLSAGGIVQPVQQGAERAVRSGKVGGAADDNTADFIELVVDVVVQGIVHAATSGFEAGAAADAALHRGSANLHYFGFHTSGVHALCHHFQRLEGVSIGMGTSVYQ